MHATLIYNKPSFGYGEYSSYFKAGEDETESSKDSIMRFIRALADPKNFILNIYILSYVFKRLFFSFTGNMIRKLNIKNCAFTYFSFQSYFSAQ